MSDIMDKTTAINTTNWADGTYVWKVIVDEKEMGSGKWIKKLGIERTFSIRVFDVNMISCRMMEDIFI